MKCDTCQYNTLPVSCMCLDKSAHTMHYRSSTDPSKNFCSTDFTIKYHVTQYYVKKDFKIKFGKEDIND